MQNSYSIWLPITGKAHRIIAGYNKLLSEKYSGPLFEPHITIIGSDGLGLSRLIKTLTDIASVTKPFELELGETDYSTTYYQAIFVRIKTTPELITLRSKLQKAFNTNSFYMPHTSLFYGYLEPLLQKKIADRIKLPKLKFKVDKLIVTPSGDSASQPKDWKHLEELDLR